MTALTDILRRQILQDGPMSVADYMSTCLMHPTHGYYTTRQVFGHSGDFVTAPDISQMFGELIGLTLAQAWIDQGSPKDIVLAEFGPGRGTLMADILRATQTVPQFHARLTVHFVETSPAMRKEQAIRVPDAHWHDQLDTLPQVPMFLVANEFFDALPIRQFTRQGAAWSERVVGVQDDSLVWGNAPALPVMALDHRMDDTKDGDIVEYSDGQTAVAQAVAHRIAANGGAALIIDYGDWRSLGDTFQALEHHQTVDPLAHSGLADLTAHVDFEAIAKVTVDAGAKHTRVTPQGVFLERLGITQRAQTLAASLSDAALKSHIAAHRRLTHPDEMGTLFKVIGLYPADANPPAGLEK